MSHYCKICHSAKSNKKFSGKGHKNHICKDCSKLSIEERNSILTLDEIYGFLNQSNISAQNIARLQTLTELKNIEIFSLAKLVLEVALLHPHKRRRLKFLAKERREIFLQLEETGLIAAHHW